MIAFLVGVGLGVLLVVVLFFPLLCAALGQRWGFGWPLGLLTGVLWGPFGILALWTADQPRLEPCEECSWLIPLNEMTCRHCGAEYFDDAVVVPA